MFKVLGSIIRTPFCMARVHTWSVLDPRVYGEARACAWRGQV